MRAASSAQRTAPPASCSAQRLRLRRVPRLDHHAHHRLGARRPDQHPAARRRARGRPRRVGRPAPRFACQSAPGLRRTLISVCGNRSTPSSSSARLAPASGRPPASTISALTMPSPVVWRSSASRWPEPSPPSCQPRREQLLEHVAVADRGAHELDAARRAAPARRRGWSSACRRRRAPQRPARGGRRPARRAARRRCRGGPRRRRPAAGRRRRRARCRSRRRCARTASTSACGAVAPKPSLMLKPSGWQPIAGRPRRRARGTRRARRGRPRRAPRRRRSSGRAASGRCCRCSCRTRCSARSRRRAGAPCRARPSRPSCCSPSSAASTSRSHASGSFSPRAEKNLMPLSANGLCEALMTTPRSRRSARVR